MTGEQITYIAIAVLIAAVVVFVVSRRRGGKVTAKWGDKSLVAEGQAPAGGIVIARKTHVESEGSVEATGVIGSGQVAEQVAEAGISVGEEATIKGAQSVKLTGVDLRDKAPR
jgi:hypothetical protein